MKALLLFILFSLFLLTGCHSGNHRDKGHLPVANETPRKYKKIENLRFGFKAMIPDDWIVTDPGDNGDGFVLRLPGIDAVPADIRIYGSFEPLNKGDAVKDTRQVFRFSDGAQGQALTGINDFMVQRNLGENKFVVFSVESGKAGWIGRNQKLLVKIAESISPLTE